MLTKVTRDIDTGSVIKTDSYEYANTNWKDQLTKYNNETITYDEIGNPLTIGSSVTMNWINGRTLSSYRDNVNNRSFYYEYNQDGIRIGKEVNGVETKYFLENNNIIFEQRGTDIIYYLYDLTGIIGLKYNGIAYNYVKNLQGDIIGILDSNNNQVVTYKYDSWGKVLSIKDSQGNEITDTTNIGIINPFRYRSYYYDTETGLYYLNSRYYNPTCGRFLNADGIIGANDDISSYNLYIYVSNNPINFNDKYGKSIFNFYRFMPRLLDPLGTLRVGMQRISKTFSKISKWLSDTVKKAIDSVEIEVGIGIGMDASFTVNKITTGVGAYQDVTYGIANSEIYSNVTGSLGVSVAGFGFSKTFEHPYPFDFTEPGFRHTPYDTIVIPRCPLSETNYSFDTPFGSFSDEGLTLEVEASLHLGVGGHVKIGWDVAN